MSNYEQLRALRNLTYTFEAGTMLFEEDDPTTELFILASGEVEILKGSQVIATITEAGTFFGEMSTLMGTPRTATGRTKKTSQVIVVPEAAVDRFFSSAPGLGLKMARILATRLADTNQKLSREVSEREFMESKYNQLVREMSEMYKDTKADNLQKLLLGHRPTKETLGK